MSFFRFDALAETPLVTEPFEHLVLPNFVTPEGLEAIGRDFPEIDQGGSFPLDSLSYGPGFQQMSEELLGTGTRNAFAAKFGMDLTGRPATLTVRGQTREKDGRVHTDGASKLITVLVYLNSSWGADGGRLRLLNSNNIDDYFTEVPPQAGTLIAFRCRDNAWHGHKPFVGERRSIQLNWVMHEAAARNNIWRHRVSAVFKKAGALVGIK